MTPLAQKTIFRLKEAVTKKGDLPSMSSTLAKIVSSMKGTEENDERLVQAVLSDVALTQKVLRLANSSMYSAFGGSVTTVSKAIFILGTETVGHLALGLKLLDNFSQAADSELAQRELGMAVMSGVVARKIGTEVAGASGEEVAVAALLRCTGRLMVCFYLPEDFKCVVEHSSGVDCEDATAIEQLGLGYGEIAHLVADMWNLPAELTVCMSDVATNPGDHASWVQSVAGYARRYVSVVASGGDTAELKRLAEQYADSVGRTADELLNVAGDAFDNSEEVSAKQAVIRRSTLRVIDGGLKTPSADPVNTTLQKLVAGYAEAQSMEGTMKPPQMTGLVSEILWDAFACTRVMFFLRRPALKHYELMVGFGAGVQDRIRQIRFEEAFSPNAFHVALSNAASVYLANTLDTNIARRVPQWLKDEFGLPKTMLLVPVVVNKASAGLLYLDWGTEGRNQTFSPVELSCIENLRSVIERSFAVGRPKTLDVSSVRGTRVSI